MKNNNFRLSAAGKLAASLAIILASLGSGYAAEIVAANGANGPGVTTAGNGAQVVNIVTPNDHGLSHNQYQDFNVNQPGAVLNNSLNAGQSQLAGQLGANPNLNNQAANVILNEVISRNPSLLLGQQEIFGMAADYVLANPNGITCNGCGFINTSRSSLVVGNPLVENGMLQGYSTLGNRNTLSLDGKLNAAGVLDLIAPRITSHGEVIVNPVYDQKSNKRVSDINAISGNNRVSRDAKVLSSEQPEVTFWDQILGTTDSYYLGSMQAGRINIVHTLTGSGVKLAGQLQGSEEIRVKAHNISAQSKVIDDNNSYTSVKNYQNYRGGIYISDYNNSQQLTRTKLKGKNISLLADNSNHLSAVDIQGDEIRLQGASLTLDGQQLKQAQGDTDNQWFYSWKYNVSRDNEQHQQIGSTISATKNATLTATKQDVKLLGTTITAGDTLKIEAKRDVQLSGLVEKDKSSERGNQRNHTSSLRTGSWYNSQETESLKASDLYTGGDLTLTAGNNLQAQGAKVHAGRNLTVDAKDQININVQKTANAKTVRDNKTSWGGIGGGNNKDNSNLREISNASELTADGILRLNGQQGVTITGSKVKGKQGGFVEASEGGLRIDNALSTNVDKVNARTGTAFNITSSSQKSNNSYQQSTASELVSDTNLQLVSKKDTDVVGSKVTSVGKLDINAGGNINVSAAEQQQRIDEQKTALTVNGYAKEQGDKQYRAGLRIEHTSDSEKTTRSEQQSSMLSGGSVALKADKDVTFTGSKLVTTKGDASVSGDNVSFLAAENKTTSDTEKTKIGGGFYYTGGIDKVGSGIEGGYENSKTHSESRKAVTSGSDIAGNLTINAKDKLTQQGAQHQVGGKYQENANSVAHLAAIDSESSHTRKTDVGVDIGANIDYSAVTRPVERAVGKAAKLDANGVINEIGGIGAPNVGLDISANGGSSEKRSSSSQAVVSTITAGDIEVSASGKLQDSGTKYQATQGSVTLTADSHQSEAAQNSRQESNSETRGGASVRVYTTTGSDLTVDAKGEGGNKRSESGGSQAVTGSITAANGIDIKVKQDAVYQGTSLDAGKGKAQVKAEDGNIRFEQATDRNHESHSGFNVKVSAKGGTSPETKSFGAGLGGGHSKGASDGSSAQVSHLGGKQGVELEAGRGLTLQGSTVTSQGDVSLKAGEKVAIQAAKSHQTRKDDTLSGNIDIGGISTDNDKKSAGVISLGGAFDIAKVDESSTTQQGGKITSGGAVNITAKGNGDQALHLQGTEVKGSSVALNAEHGGVMLESAQNQEQKNNWNLGLKANVKGGQSFNKDANGKVDTTSGSDTHTLGAGVKVGVDKLQKTTQGNSLISADEVTLNSGKDTTLAGARIDADRVQGNVGGDLHVESRKDSESSVKVNVDVGLSHTNDPASSITSKLSKVGTPHYAGKVKEKLEGGINKVADATTDKYNSVARRLDPKQDTTGAVSFSKADSKVTLPEMLVGEKEKAPLWDRGARFLGNKSKESLTGPAGLQGQFKVNADVVNNDAVGVQSAISGKNDVTLNVQGNTHLTGGEIRSQQGEVTLGNGKLEQQDVAGNRYQGGGHLDAAASAGALLGIAGKSVVNLETPVGGYINNQAADAKAGVFSGK